MKRFFLLTALLTGMARIGAAQCTVPTLPSQDCQGAIPLCRSIYVYPTGAICGPGNVEDEIPSGSCLSANERNTTWYTFTARTPGLLRFSIKPLDDISPSDSGSLDYDWALFKLPAGSYASAPTCSLMTNNLSWQASCNYSADRGATGMLDTSGMEALNTQGAGGTKWNQPLQVQGGETFVLAVDNFTGDDALTGYVVRFSNKPGSTNVELGNEPFYFTAVQSQSDTVQLTTSRGFACQYMTTGAVKVFNPGDLTQVYNVSHFAPRGVCNGFSTFYNLVYSPYAPTLIGDLRLVVRDSIQDVCGNIFTVDTIPLRAGLRTGLKPAATLGDFAIFPQPNAGEFSLDLRGMPQQDCRLMITEAVTGKQVWASAARGGLVNQVVPKKALAPGLYLVEVRQGERRFSQKMVVER